MNLWILTEERPKKEVIIKIIERFSKDYKKAVEIGNIKIIPEVADNKFTFKYIIKGIKLQDTLDIFLKIASGDSSFVDFLIFYQKEEPKSTDTPLYLIEETKTDDKESRNTGVYQRCSKFVYANFYYPSVPKIMLYNLKVEQKESPTLTYIFGTRMLITLGVEIIGKKLNNLIFKPFSSIQEFIELKNKMPDPNYGIPVKLKEDNNSIKISAKLEKSGNLSHDPNIGMTTIMASCLRKLGWKKDIIIISHCLPKQRSVGRDNKFIQIANKLNIKLDGLSIPVVDLPKNYWQIEKNKEKIGTIFIHLLCEEFTDSISIYENHGGCERGYFIDVKNKKYLVIPKYKDRAKYKEGHKEYIISIPDVVIYDRKRNIILNCEGKTYDKKEEGIRDLKNYDFFEERFIKKFYPKSTIIRTVILSGGRSRKLDEQNYGFLLNADGELIIREDSPDTIKEAVKNLLNLNKVN